MSDELQKLTLFYDGECPLCQAEILFLSSRNKTNLLDFININSERYDPLTIGVSCERALAVMYGQYADGTLLHGVSVFPEAYRRVDLPFLAWIFSMPTLQPMLEVGYRFFAKNRHGISRIFGPSAFCFVRNKVKKAKV